MEQHTAAKLLMNHKMKQNNMYKYISLYMYRTYTNTRIKTIINKRKIKTYHRIWCDKNMVYNFYILPSLQFVCLIEFEIQGDFFSFWK